MCSFEQRRELQKYKNNIYRLKYRFQNQFQSKIRAVSQGYQLVLHSIGWHRSALEQLLMVISSQCKERCPSQSANMNSSVNRNHATIREEQHLDGHAMEGFIMCFNLQPTLKCSMKLMEKKSQPTCMVMNTLHFQGK